MSNSGDFGYPWPDTRVSSSKATAAYGSVLLANGGSHVHR